MNNFFGKIKKIFGNIFDFCKNHIKIIIAILLLIGIIIGISFIIIGNKEVEEIKKNKEVITAYTLIDDLYKKINKINEKKRELEREIDLLEDKKNDSDKDTKEIDEEIAEINKKIDKYDKKYEKYYNELLELQYIDSEEQKEIDEMNNVTIKSKYTEVGIILIIICGLGEILLIIKKIFSKNKSNDEIELNDIV